MFDILIHNQRKTRGRRLTAICPDGREVESLSVAHGASDGLGVAIGEAYDGLNKPPFGGGGHAVFVPHRPIEVAGQPGAKQHLHGDRLGEQREQ